MALHKMRMQDTYIAGHQSINEINEMGFLSGPHADPSEAPAGYSRVNVEDWSARHALAGWRRGRAAGRGGGSHRTNRRSAA